MINLIWCHKIPASICVYPEGTCIENILIMGGLILIEIILIIIYFKLKRK